MLCSLHVFMKLPSLVPDHIGTKMNGSRHRPARPTTVALTTTSEGRRRDVALGLVPSQGRGGGHRRHLNPSINQCTQFSYLGVPAPAGMGDWYESMSRTPIRDRWLLSPNSLLPRRRKSKEGMGGGTARINHRSSNATIQREQGSASSPSMAED